ncbi:hypothetical protein [Curtobacterium sp. 458]|uniref:hypothetical protein n=1 Tax=Curtobacterium sp. 458 TaxID=3050069 RepID=UPI0025B41326|nr:hypothetical protein [Curtobacterium sp. 458]WJY00838.1 hypothetical protein QPJ90_03855 [Curtobacterium sp. 458]
MSVDMGDLPGWVTAGIALGGVVFGGWNLRSLAVTRLRAQADRVYLDYEFEYGEVLSRIHVLNLSDAPISSVEVFVRTYPEWTWDDSARKSRLLMQEGWELLLRYPGTASWVMSYVSFTDATGRRWYRMSNGKLYTYRLLPSRLASIRYFLPDWYVKLRTRGMGERRNGSGFAITLSLENYSDGRTAKSTSRRRRAASP